MKNIDIAFWDIDMYNEMSRLKEKIYPYNDIETEFNKYYSYILYLLCDTKYGILNIIDNKDLITAVNGYVNLCNFVIRENIIPGESRWIEVRDNIFSIYKNHSTSNPEISKIAYHISESLYNVYYNADLILASEECAKCNVIVGFDLRDVQSAYIEKLKTITEDDLFTFEDYFKETL